MTSKLSNSFISLSGRNFRYFFCGQAISLCGTWMQQMALSWLAYSLTGSAALMGIVMFLTQAPSLIIAPAAGVRADRTDKRKMLIIIQTAFVLQSGTLALLTLSGRISPAFILLMAFIQGLITAYDFPFRQSLVPEMLEKREHLQNALALNSLVVNASKIIGPSIAGLLVAQIGEGWCFLFNSFSYLGAIVALSLMNIKAAIHIVSDEGKLDNIKQGFNYVWHHKQIRAVMAMLIVASFIGTSYMTLLPVLAKDVLHGNASSMGFLMAFTGVGAIFSGAFLALRSNIRGLDRLIGYAVCLGGAAFILLGNCSKLPVAYTIMPFIGMSLTFQMTSSNTFVQTNTENSMRGRVMGIYGLIWNGISPFGNLLYGFSAEYIGTPYTIFGGGLIMVCASVLYLFFRRGKFSK